MKRSLLALRVLRLFDGLILSRGISSPSMDCNGLCLNLSFKLWVKDNYFFKPFQYCMQAQEKKSCRTLNIKKLSNESTLVISVFGLVEG